MPRMTLVAASRRSQGYGFSGSDSRESMAIAEAILISCVSQGLGKLTTHDVKPGTVCAQEVFYT